jgi:hypothetical protein
MIALHFNLQLVQFFADHRNPFLTRLFTVAGFFGTADFYFLVTILLYVVWDKRQAIRLSVLILLTMTLNEVLKMLIGNPRPFVREGTYLKKWAVSPADALRPRDGVVGLLLLPLRRIQESPCPSHPRARDRHHWRLAPLSRRALR